MSALRLGILPDGTREVRVLEPAVGRTSFTRYGMRASGEFIVPVSKRYHVPDTRKGAHTAKERKFVDDRVRKNPDNGAVEASITEVHP